jgi:hypothetical protein
MSKQYPTQKGIRYSRGNFKELQAAEEALNIFKKERALCC